MILKINLIKKLALIIAIELIFASPSFSKVSYKIAPNNSTISWKTKYFSVIEPAGKFSDIDGIVLIDEKNPKLSSINITIKTDSIETNFKVFDKLLTGKGFFNSKKYPEISFISSNIKLENDDNVAIEGVLELHGTKKNITIQGKIKQTTNLKKSESGKENIVNFSSKIDIKRSDFGMDFAMVGISNNVEIYIDVEAIR